jgi:hypothetical protein
MPRPWLADEPVGLADIAARLGLQKATLTTMRSRDQMPRELGELSKRAPWWYWTKDIVPWAVKQGYLTEDGERAAG